MTGPGRPGREDQASLSALAAEGLGWDYSELLAKMLDSASLLGELRHARLPEVARIRTADTHKVSDKNNKEQSSYFYIIIIQFSAVP